MSSKPWEVHTSFCSAIDFDSGGLPTLIRNGYVNVNQAKVKGVDFEVSYRAEPDFFSGEDESLTLRMLAGSISERSDTPLGGTLRDVSGSLGSPDLTGNATLSYSAGPYNFRLQQRYIADTLRDDRWVEGVDVDDNTVSSGNYTNMQVGYSGDTDDGGSWNVALNVTNVFNRPPPIVANYSTGGTAQSIPNGYDLYGRRYQVSFGLNF